jgi:hypothetical protein
MAAGRLDEACIFAGLSIDAPPWTAERVPMFQFPMVATGQNR